MSQRWTALYMVAFSTVAATMIVVASWPRLAAPPSIGLWGKSLVGGTFVASCVYGISIAVHPGWTGRLIPRDRVGVSSGSAQVRGRRGHHPDCGFFESHTLRWRGKVLCAGCTGIAAGCVISIPLMGLYLALPVEWSVGVLRLLLILGLGLVGVKYMETALPRDGVAPRVASNALLIVGFFLVVIGALELSGSAIVGFLGVFVSFLFLDTRIQLSRWRHVKTCRDCRQACKVYVD